ncbi:MAG TPA: hypothetical protein VLS89_08255, partial [Candidatus Nanopelagicales bacterium]|nr:hypothetical protein [Candidatus Nanopelagicales bacterium]
MPGTQRPPPGSRSSHVDVQIAHAATTYPTSSDSLSSFSSAGSVAKVCPTCGVRYPAEFKVCPRDASALAD